MTDLVYLKCIKVGSKLRVKIITPGYNNEANCQFPRAIRAEGRTYVTSTSAIKFGGNERTKFFYRISKNDIKIVEETNIKEIKITLKKIFDNNESECIICMDNACDIVIVPCGHYCMCSECSKRLTKRECPICRGRIDMSIPRSMVKVD